MLQIKIKPNHNNINLIEDMQRYLILILLSLSVLTLSACNSQSEKKPTQEKTENTTQTTVPQPQPAALYPTRYLPILKSKKVGLVVNHTSMVGNTHLVDFLKEKNIEISKIFTPEHGFKGTADAGEKVHNDEYKTIPIVSLYGDNKKPKANALKNIELLVFDMQDVGTRFYTYISTLHYIMEAAAENNIELLVLDRPNPNGHYVDGPIREAAYESFVAKHPIPVVHGLTVGELAQMINGEGWLNNGIKCKLSIIMAPNYNHNISYDLPVKPSPNLPNTTSILLYPSLCFFEGTSLSIGRGTDKQFQIIGHPSLNEMAYTFTPQKNEGAKYPKLENEQCYGIDLSTIDKKTFFLKQQLNLAWLIDMYNVFPDKANFFLENNFFDKLAGTADLQQQIKEGLSEETIRAFWQADLSAYKKMRKKYLLYQDFE